MADVAQVLAADPAQSPAALIMGAEERKRRNRIAEALVMQGLDTSPVQHWTQGAARVANALAGTIEERRLDRDERAGADQFGKLLLSNPALGGGGGAPAAAAPSSGAIAMPTVGAGVPAGDAIASIESSGRYDALGPVIEKTGDRAYGKYQVMGANIPEWTKKHVGRSMTPQEFLTSPEVQDAVFKGQFGGYQQKYGPEGAARAWFAGENGMNDLTRKDPLGTTVGGYGKKFAAATAGAPTVTDAGAPGATPPASTGFPPQLATVAAIPSAAAGAPGSTATAAAAPGPTPGDARPAPSVPPQVAQWLKALIATRNPQAIAYAQQELAKWNKPSELDVHVAGDSVIVTDKATGRKVAEHAVRKSATFGDIGADPQTGRERKGFIDTNNKTVDPYAMPTAAGAAPSKIPAVPAGVDPKIWNEYWSKKQAEESLPGTDENAQRLRKEVADLPSYKNLAQAAPIYKTMLASAGNNTKASDLNLVYGLGKIFDPGSVVREGEMIMVKNTASVPDWFVGTVNSLNGGAALTPETRKAIMEEARIRIQAYQGQFDQDAQMYHGIAERNRFDRRDILPHFGEFPRWEPPAPAPGASSPPPAAAAPPQPAAPAAGQTKSGVQWRVN